MSKDSKTTYDPAHVESAYYAIWEERGYFEPESASDKPPFCVMLPPPNVTGRLHIGHALNQTLIDIITRYKRMDGYNVLWQPGVDHAGIATQTIVSKQLAKEGLSKESLGREAFLKRVWEWREQSGSQILQQMRSLGASCAWNRTRFTMDEGLANCVKDVFCRLYDEGFIFRGEYMVNWCTNDGALSDIEVEHHDNKGNLYHLRYPLSDKSDAIIVATTRPETFFGDTAVMVHPNDARYAHLIGKKVILPLVGREIPIVADAAVDREFGSGAVKVTPAHDPNDYEVGKRHQLPFVVVFDSKGILNEHAGEFAGLERLAAREAIVAKLQDIGAIEKIEEHNNQVGRCYRCGNVIEPYISKQWFVRKELANDAIKASNARRLFYPEQWKNNYNAWMRELRDWCISRQLWWGHRIPVFYCQCGHEFAARTEPTSCPKCGSHEITQDPDVLDTWFSSALWAFSTLGYANGAFGKGSVYDADDLRRFYPNTLLITGFDILFFWVARMLMMGQHLLGELPFRDVYLHALVRDENGQKMSKSLGNVIDPLEIIQTHSADALRFTLATLCVLGRDIRLSRSQLDISKNFTNKLYNAAQFLLLYHQNFAPQTPQTPLGRYMYSRFSHATQQVREALDSYRFNDGASVLYRFLWGEFCDWGIELAKANKESIPELGAVFLESMKLLHPFMPFISEYLYSLLSGVALESRDSIMIMPYPKAEFFEPNIEESFANIIDTVISIRRLKANLEMPSAQLARVFVKADNLDSALLQTFVPQLCKAQALEIVHDVPPNCLADIGEHVAVYVEKSTLDLRPIIERLHKQAEKNHKEKEKLQAMLGNEKFLANAPAELVQKNRDLLEKLEIKLARIADELQQLT